MKTVLENIYILQNQQQTRWKNIYNMENKKL